MRTMTDDAYVWHVPVLEGATGGEAVRDFYSSRFFGHTPADTVLPISRTVSAQRVIDEFALSSPTTPSPLDAASGRAGRPARAHPQGRRDGFDGHRVASEHIYCDQASVLVQVGLLETNRASRRRRRAGGAAAGARGWAPVTGAGAGRPWHSPSPC